MKQIAILFFLVAFYSCTESKSDQTVATNKSNEKNLAAVAEINKAIQTGDVSNLDKYIAADAIDHASPMGDIKGIDSIKMVLGKIHTMGTDMKMESIRKVADDEYVFEWMRLTGVTATADWGMPVGTRYDVNAVQVSRFKDGKVIEHWEFMQPADLAHMMDGNNIKPAIPDTTKK